MSGAGSPLSNGFFDRPPRQVAVDLIGCTLLRDGVGGRVVETEAYEADDPACHAYGGITARNAPLFGPPGRTYVYLCYGVHSLFNVVTDADGIAAAVLVRALQPTRDLASMRTRRDGCSDDRQLCSGPGKVCEALAIDLADSGRSALEKPYALLGRPHGAAPRITAGPRIGLTKAADNPWRYCLADSRYLSRPAG